MLYESTPARLYTFCWPVPYFLARFEPHIHIHPHLALTCQVAGFVAKFKPGLTFATVKGAGHMVPTSNPKEALELVSRFLSNSL